MGVAASHNTDLSGLSNILNNEMQRQIALTTLQFENEQAIKKAQSRESFNWQFLAGGTSLAAIILCAQLTKNRMYAIPVVPIVMFLGYRWDQTYGTTSETIRKEAERLLKTEHKILRPVGGPITLEEIDRRRMMWKQNCETSEKI